MPDSHVDVPLAQKAREEGNVAFKKGKWSESIGHYTQATVYNPSDPIAFCNRAQAYLKLDKFLDAERDCTSALSLQQGHIKALYRRALARKGLGRFAEALVDIDELLRLEANETAGAEKRELLALQERDTKLNRREISHPEEEPRDSSPSLPVTPPSFAALRKTRDAKKPTYAQVQHDAAPVVPSYASPPPRSAAMPQRPLSPPPDPISNTPGTTLALLRKISSHPPSDAWSYLSVFPAHNVPLLLTSLLDPEVLGGILPVLAHGASEDPAKVKEIMLGLKQTPRWRLNAAMLSDGERQTGRLTWERSGGEGAWP